MVAAQEEEIFRIFDLVGEEKTDAFKCLLSSVDAVVDVKVVVFGLEPALFEETEKVAILTMDASTDLDRSLGLN